MFSNKTSFVFSSISHSSRISGFLLEMIKEKKFRVLNSIQRTENEIKPDLNEGPQALEDTSSNFLCVKLIFCILWE